MTEQTTQRQRRSPQEKAQTDLDKANAQVARLEKRVERDQAAADRIEKNRSDLEFARKQRDLLAEHPALADAETVSDPFTA